MRLHQLEVTAFGPYSGHESVDFDELGSDGLFLLHGDTGAGKTTLLDAIAFALYGTVPGARNDVKRLRCDTAPADVPTSVSLELTVQGYRLRVERSPEYQRPKKTGEGYTTQKAKASLTWLSTPPGGESAEGITRIDEVARTVQRLLGMSVEQFFQVVMLPQGQFARFLRAETAERATLLDKLFGTERFGQVETWFAEQRRQQRRELEERSRDADELFARVVQVVGAEPEEGADRSTWLEDEDKRLTREFEDAQAEQTRTRRDRDDAEATLARRRDLAERVRRVRQAKDSLRELDERRADHENWRAELDAAQRSVAVLAAKASADGTAAELSSARDEVAAAAARCPDVDTEADLERLRSDVAGTQEQAGALAQLVTEAEQQEQDRQRLTDLAERVDTDLRADAELVEQQEGLPDRITEARRQLERAREADTRRESVVARVDELTALLDTARQLPAAEQELATAETRASEAVDAHQRARDTVQDLRQRRLAGMAAELAAGLTSGEACPVCGSQEHPAPSDEVDDRVDAETEERAQAAEQAAHAEREEANNTAALARQRCERLRDRLGAWTESELVAELERARTERDEVTAEADAVGQRTETLSELEALTERIATRRAELATNVAALRSEHAALAETVEQRRARLVEARGEFDGVEQRRRHLLDRAARVERLVAARVAVDDAARRDAERQAAVVEAAREAGFDDVAAAVAADRDEQRCTELREALADVDRRRASARATLEELSDVDPDTDAGVEAAEEEAARARQAVERAAAEVHGAERRLSDLRDLAQRLRRAWERLGPAQARFAELDALADVVNGQGQNARKMTLRSYVLAARLEEVAVAATRRLQRMSEGRYSFVHSDAAGARGTRGGLGLDVLDDYSGQTRSTKTLSGGESFLASLSLALGLADVVAAESGGALLDTLFIDEGFGTLDADTLDLVMDALDELRAGGRVVGLVSHVEEMRQRINVRLRVRKSRTGSTLAVES